jgi:hypothetical protein
MHSQDTTINRLVAEACTADLLHRLREVREDRDMYREMLSAALTQIAALSGRVREQTTTIRQLTTRNRLLTRFETPIRQSAGRGRAA